MSEVDNMLLTKEVEVELNSSNIKYYEDLGYDIPRSLDKRGRLTVARGTKMVVQVDDLPNTTMTEVECLCDYCKQTIIKKSWKEYTIYNLNGVIHTDCCMNKECLIEKRKESNLKTKGVEWGLSLDEVKDKRKQTVIEKYNCENVFQSEDIKNKSKETNLERYGVEYIAQSSEILSKIRQTLKNSGKVNTSRPQLYLHYLLGGELNYPIGNCNLDIAFPNDKIYIEYNGGGHALNVTFGDKTKEEFEQKEIKRYMFLKNNGWKQVRIVSQYDYLPSDEVILNEIEKAKEWFKSSDYGHWHYVINIGGKVRRIKEKDLNKYEQVV